MLKCNLYRYTKALPTDAAEIALAFAENPADPQAQKLALAKIGAALSKAAQEANWEGIQGAASSAATAAASNGLLVQVPEAGLYKFANALDPPA